MLQTQSIHQLSRPLPSDFRIYTYYHFLIQRLCQFYEKHQLWFQKELSGENRYEPRLFPIQGKKLPFYLSSVHQIGAEEELEFITPATHYVTARETNLYTTLNEPKELDHQLVRGALFDVYDSHSGWAWGQNISDGYVGYVRLSDLNVVYQSFSLTHQICVPMSHIYQEPDIKKGVKGTLFQNSYVEVLEQSAPQDERFCKTATGYLFKKHLRPINQNLQLEIKSIEDYLSIAMTYLNAPYLWGGKTYQGIDCSGLVQLCLQALDCFSTRDSDLQRSLGRVRSKSDKAQRGDLALFKGHIGFMLDEKQILHANSFHMQVTVDDIEEVKTRAGEVDYHSLI